MKVKNFSNSEITLKNSIKTGTVLGACFGIAKTAHDCMAQHCAINHYYKFHDKFTKQKQYAEELTGQFLNKCPKITQNILNHFDKKITKLTDINRSEKIDLKNILKSSAKTAFISAVIIGGVYFIIKTVKNILETNNN